MSWRSLEAALPWRILVRLTAALLSIVCWRMPLRIAARALVSAVALVLAVVQPAQAILVDNGIAGDGRWEVDVLNGGSSRVGNLDPTGPIASTNIIFDYFHYVDPGADGGGILLQDSTITTPAFVSGPNQVTSAGSFAGSNGTINWTAVSSIAAGSPTYQTSLGFSSTSSFGMVRVIQYLDEDVLGVSDDRLIVLGTPGASDFQLLTIDDIDNVGVAHSATYLTATNMTYIGWAADRFSDLRDAIEGPGALYSIPGVVDITDLPPIIGGDPRFPGRPAFGDNDITSAIAFDLNATASSASLIFALGGSPEGSPPPPIEAVPEPSTLVLLGTGLAGVAGAASRRRRRA